MLARHCPPAAPNGRRVTVQCVNGAHLVWDVDAALLLRQALHVVPQPCGFAKPVTARVARKWTAAEIAAARARHAAAGGRSGKGQGQEKGQGKAGSTGKRVRGAVQQPQPQPRQQGSASGAGSTTSSHGHALTGHSTAPAAPASAGQPRAAPAAVARATGDAERGAGSSGGDGRQSGGSSGDGGSSGGGGSGSEPRCRDDTAAGSSHKRRRVSAPPQAQAPEPTQAHGGVQGVGGGGQTGVQASAATNGRGPSTRDIPGSGASGGGKPAVATLPLPGVSMPCLIPVEAVALGLRHGWIDLKGPLYKATKAAAAASSAESTIPAAAAQDTAVAPDTSVASSGEQGRLPLAAGPMCRHCAPPSPRQLLLNAVYEDLWCKGYRVTSGIKFGGDFLAYAADPQDCHASFIVIVVEAGQTLPPCAFVASSRVSVIARKHQVLASVDAQGAVQYVWFRWIPDPPPRVPRALKEARAAARRKSGKHGRRKPGLPPSAAQRARTAAPPHGVTGVASCTAVTAHRSACGARGD